jgi:2-dehydropantoate 2-reductase
MSHLVDEKRWVFGGVTFISWQRDQKLDGGCSNGVNYWIPPFAAIALVGEKDACREVEEILVAGGLKATVRGENFLKLQAATTALISAFVAGFELAGWSFGAYRRSPWLKFAAKGAREACLSQLPEMGIFYKTLFGIITTRATFFVSTFLLPILTPFDLENYLRFHYLKTRKQTLNLLDIFIRDGKNQGLPVGNIELLRQGLLGSGGDIDKLLIKV